MFSVKSLLCLALVLVACAPLFADPTTFDPPGNPQTVNVWPGLAPGETSSSPGVVTSKPGAFVTIVTNVSGAQLIVYRPDNQSNHPAVVIFPGGGYYILSVVREGTEIAQWLNTQGYVAAVLVYRVPGNRNGAFQDAERAVSLFRSRASEFGADPTKIGVLGFSAGGHLAARLSVGYATRAYPNIDSADTLSCRPDFTVLIYPAYLADKGNVVAPEVLPGTNPPPTFLAQTRQDPFFDILPYANVLLAVGGSVEALAYDGGGHGYGLHPPASAEVSNWPTELAAWLKLHTTTP